MPSLVQIAADLFGLIRRRPSKGFHQKRLSFTQNSEEELLLLPKLLISLTQI
jgi:hypothetical protein